ncbi:OLC1v1004632C1 [Oldenlandia corymbosa var. corymbosa]|uniref:OLC1v1004632C1 n=1 Tax=Oldenlandia corymbosa var. corymbosa TaxID=529605 RepID=A0AAV1DF48_OLDCO|nr:OLC1v1004632C1 [Oldenlandia corymbosa var. corymbosa]
MERSIEPRASSSEKLQKCSHGNDASPVDRISNLPEPIICHILSFLPTKFAVGTSILSKSWQFLWAKVNTLDFNDELLLNSDEEEDEDDEFAGGGDGDGENKNFEEFVNSVFIRHKSVTLEKFRLRWRRGGCHAGYINTWFRDAIARNVKVIDLNVDYPDSAYVTQDIGFVYHLPGTLFTCKTLEFLSLEGPFLFKIPAMVCLPKLAVLQLIKVSYEIGSDESFCNFISSCLVLDSLSITRSSGDNLIVCAISSRSLRFLQLHFYSAFLSHWSETERLTIDAPALEHLIWRDEVSRIFSLQGLSSLSKVQLGLHALKCYSDCYNLVVKQVEAVNCAKSLELTRWTSIALACATTSVSTRFENLTELCITCRCCGWSFLNDLMDCAKKLEVLRITIGSSCKRKHKRCWRKPTDVLECLLHSLVQVSFTGFEGLKHELELIRYILKHGSVMKRVNLDIEAASRDSLLQEKISMFPRISHSCRIKFS